MSVIEADLNLEMLLDYLKRSRGFDFTGYKRSTLTRRILRRMEMIGTEAFSDYIDFLEVHPDEFAQLFNMILINVTSFFRDAPIWEHLASDILPRLLAGKASNAPIRVWSAGCASGEEACTVAMLLADALGLEEFRQRVKIYGTDIDDDALTQARQAIYSERQVQGVPARFLEKYFDRIDHHFAFHRDLRRSIIFGRHDLIQDAPISRIDLLICRNTLMYFNAETQARIMASFHFALHESGALLLGKAEMLFSHTHLFVPLDLKRRVFSKALHVNVRGRLMLAPGDETLYQLANEIRIREMVFETEMAAQIVVDPEGRLALANAHARSLFRLTPADLGRPLQDLELSYRPAELRAPVELALLERRPISLKNVVLTPLLGEPIFLDVRITPLLEGGMAAGLAAPPSGVSITFVDVTYYKRLQDDLQAANQELETAYEEVQSTSEELETTNEELQSTNEELETTNEELQSTNEELETMNAELQSTNEELETLNNEVRDRSAQLSEVSAFLEAILTSLGGGVIVLDADMRIQLWNRQSENLWGLRADETTGKSLLSLDIGLPVERLLPLLRACLTADAATDETARTETARTEITLPAINRRGRAIRCRVTCTPVRRDEASIQSVLLIIEAQEAVPDPDVSASA